ncbi:MAG: hypothetical protein CL424_10870 [Acidimicrobiaceae bacterium]|nr:hypothetical protein [Acidimicrobiaceae bacterium]
MFLEVMLQLGVAVALIVSVVQFATKQTAPRRRRAAVASAIVLPVLLSVYYARSLSATAMKLATEWGGDAGEPSRFWVAVHDGILWYYEIWMERLLWLSAGADPAFRVTMIPLSIVLATYLFRSGVYRYARYRYPTLNQLTSASWVHITAWLVSLACLQAFFGLGRIPMVAIVVASLLVAFAGLVGVLGDVGRALGWLGMSVVELLRLAWKWLTVLAIKTMRGLRALRERFDAVWFDIKRPIINFAAAVERKLEQSSVRAEEIMARDEAEENPPPIDFAA